MKLIILMLHLKSAVRMVLRQGNYITTRLNRVVSRAKVGAIGKDILMRVLKRPGLYEGGKTAAGSSFYLRAA